MIKAWLEKRKEKVEAKRKLKQFKKYYKVVREGLLFIKFVQDDIAQQKKDKVNRTQRRRFEKNLCNEGKLTEEIVQHYKAKIDSVLKYIDMELTPKKPIIKKAVVTPNDLSANSGVKNPYSDDAIKAEYKLIQEKKSKLPLNERKKVVSLYNQKFGAKK